ncbi:MAG: hypothetical protein CMC73_06265 [Flavobacteriaceae bacterium]|nr:hypothetical protein [Flavobacteriaceae bacterium]
MKFSLWTQYGAMNSKPVFNAFEKSLKDAGHSVVHNNNDADVNVIWSVLWNGRMAANQSIWNNNKPTIVLEIGGIKRGTTWRVGLNGINRDAYFGDTGMDSNRSSLQGLELTPWRTQGKHILLCGQHEKSEQWRGMPSMSKWVMQTIENIQKHTDRPIYFRPHPRCPLPEIEKQYKNVYRQAPQHILGSYDDFDMSFKNAWAVVCHSSNPGPQSIMSGIPAFVSTSSIAYDVGNDIDFWHDIESPLMPDRQQWLNDYAWTEYTVDEISQGMPLKRLTTALSNAII